MSATNDLIFVLGFLAVLISIPSLLNGWTEGSLPRFGTLMALGGVVMVGVAMNRHPGGYGFADVIPAFGRVFHSLLN